MLFGGLVVAAEAELGAIGLRNRTDEERKVTLLDEQIDPLAPQPLPLPQNFRQLRRNLLIILLIPIPTQLNISIFFRFSK